MANAAITGVRKEAGRAYASAAHSTTVPADAHVPGPGRTRPIPKNVATGLENIGEDEGWLVNYPDPPYDPALKDEQVEYTLEELETGVLK